MKKTVLLLTQIIVLLSTISSITFAQSWPQLDSDIDGEAADDWSGWSVALSSDGSRVAIGASLNDGNGSLSGHVRIFYYNGAAWIKLGLDIDGEAAGDYSGYSVSLSSDGSRVAIGAIYNDGNGDNSGHVRVYEYSGTPLAWTKLGDDIDGEAADDRLGGSVSLSSDGSRVAIGAYQNTGVNGFRSGHVRVYEYSGSAWIKLGDDIDGEAADDLSGVTVSLSSDGSRVAIGALLNHGVNGTYARLVGVYNYRRTAWIKLGDDIDGEAAGDYSGNSVSLSSDGSRVAIGAPYNAGNGNQSGHVRIFYYNGAAWIKLGDDIDGEAAGDLSGRSVSLSSDGNRVAIGAPYNAGNGSASGHVRIFYYNGSAWIKLGDDIDGEVAGDWSGISVSLSSDGSRVAIGAPHNAGNGGDSGHVRVFFWDPYIIISGYVKYNNGAAVEGVEVAFSNSGLTATTDATGYYERYITRGWSGTATPSMDKFTFSPNSYTYSNVQTDLPNQDYVGIRNSVTISGYVRNNVNIGIGGVDVAFSNGGATVTTNATGHYLTSVSSGWGGTSTATKTGWAFTPTSYTYPPVTANQTDQDYEGRDVILAVNDINSLPTDFTVLPAYPNPFNPSTTISYGLGSDSYVSIQIYDITGQLITTLLNGDQHQGWHSVIWNGTNNHDAQVPAGIYLSRIASDNEVKTTKLMLLK